MIKKERRKKHTLMREASEILQRAKLISLILGEAFKIRKISESEICTQPAIFRLVKTGHLLHRSTAKSGSTLLHCCRSRVCSLAKEEGEEGGERERRGLFPIKRDCKVGM